MVRLDLTVFKYLTTEDFRVLMAIELGMRNHEYVPPQLIETLARLKRVNVHKVIQNLLKNKLIEHTNQKYDGYSLNYLGYDFLAIRALLKKGILVKILSRMGVGKESDVFHCLINTHGLTKELNDEEIEKAQIELIAELDNKGEDFDDISLEDIHEKNEEEEAQDEDGEDEVEEENNEKIADESKEGMIKIDDYNQLKDIYTIPQLTGTNLIPGILKLARLGRTSFRAVKNKRDFAKNKTHYNWLYLSRLSSQTEYKFLNGLFNNGFPVPKPYGCNRHAIAMEYIPGYQLSRVNEIANPEKVYNNLTRLIYKFAEAGLVHGDYNEFNIIIGDDENVRIIDFTQMISRDHAEAELYFMRDLKGVRNYFKKKFYLSFTGVDLNETLKDVPRIDFLDVSLNAFGAIKKHDDRDDLEKIEQTQDADNYDMIDNDHLHEFLGKNQGTHNEGAEDEKGVISKEGGPSKETIVISKKEIMKKVMRVINSESKHKIKVKGKNSKSKNSSKQDLDF